MRRHTNLLALTGLVLFTSLFVSCDDSDDNNPPAGIEAPTTYNFTRNGESTVSFSGQTTRIAMATEIIEALKETSLTDTEIKAMFAHEEGASDFSDADLNASSKDVRSKSAASIDYFSNNSTESMNIKSDFDSWITAQVDEVFPNWNTDASSGVAGKIQQAGGGAIRYVNAKGLEYNQVFAKSLIGALMVDQILNNYLSTAKLDAGTLKEDNNADTVLEGKNYTAMEHYWDEAYGYLYGAEADYANPVLGADKFLNEYLGKVEEDADFAGIADDVFNAFKLGRAAIVAKDYELRDRQIAIIRTALSEVLAIRGVYYLQSGKDKLSNDDAAAFHALSEAYGFIYSLQFTRNVETGNPYASKSEVDVYLQKLMENNGFWDIDTVTLDEVSEDIAAEFDFTVSQAK